MPKGRGSTMWLPWLNQKVEEAQGWLADTGDWLAKVNIDAPVPPVQDHRPGERAVPWPAPRPADQQAAGEGSRQPPKGFAEQPSGEGVPAPAAVVTPQPPSVPPAPPPAPPPAQVPSGHGLGPGAPVEIYSESQQAWLQGQVLHISDFGFALVAYCHVNGASVQKELPLDHPHLRLPQGHVPRHPSAPSKPAGGAATPRQPQQPQQPQQQQPPPHQQQQQQTPQKQQQLLQHQEVPPKEQPYRPPGQTPRQDHPRQSATPGRGGGDGDPQQLLAEVLAHCNDDGRWEDGDFPPVPSSLCHDWESYRPRGCDFRTLVWRRAEQVLPGIPVLPAQGVGHRDTKQGCLGDCYFLAALSAFAHKQRGHVQRLLCTSPEALRAGVSVCRLSWNGRWRNLPVSHTFPCYHWGPLAFSSVEGGKALWVPLLEKAWAKLHGSYQAIVAGSPAEALRALSGAPCKHLSLEDARQDRCDTKLLTPSRVLDADSYAKGTGSLAKSKAGDTSEAVWKQLTDAVKKGYPVCASCGGAGEEEHEDHATGLIRGHAYTVLEARLLDGSATPSVRLRNPWGRGRWRGAPQRQGETGDDGDGVFWMHYRDFIQQFNSIDIGLIRSGYDTAYIDAHLVHGLGPCKAALVRLVPQADGEVTISVLQPSRRRGQEKAKTWKEINDELHSVGFEVFGPPSSRSQGLTLVAASPFQPRQEVAIEVTLRAGVEYFVALRAAPRRGGAPPAGLRLCTYAPGPPVSFANCQQSPEELQRSAWETQVREQGDVVWEEDGAEVRLWTADTGDPLVLLFKAPRNRPMLAYFEWSLTNMLLRRAFPDQPPDPKDVAAVASGQKYRCQQVVELPPGGRQLTAITWANPREASQIEYSFVCGTKPCSVCKAPVGVQVPGRFCGEYVYWSPPAMFGAALGAEPKYAHSECKSFAKLRDASMRKLRHLQ